MSLLNIRSVSDFRAFLYVALPAVVGIVSQTGQDDQNEATLWVALVLAIIGPVMAFINAKNVSTFRTAFYAVVGAASALLIAYGIFSQDEIEFWTTTLAAVLNLVVGGVAAANTPTTSPIAGRHTAEL